MRTTQSIDYSEAQRAIDLIVEKALQMQKAAVVAVADSHGELICFARMDGAPVSSIRIAMNKAWTAPRERKPTKEIGDKVKHPEKGHDIALWFAKTLRAILQRLLLLGVTSSAWDSRLIRRRRELRPRERGPDKGYASALIKEKQLGRQHNSS